MLGFEFLVKNNFSWKMISTKQRFKQNKIGSWQAPTKHELAQSAVKISNRKAVFQAFTKRQEILSILRNTKSP